MKLEPDRRSRQAHEAAQDRSGRRGGVKTREFGVPEVTDHPSGDPTVPGVIVCIPASAEVRDFGCAGVLSVNPGRRSAGATFVEAA